jgi:hypothetical protein
MALLPLFADIYSKRVLLERRLSADTLLCNPTMSHDLRNYKTPAQDDKLPQYSEADPIHSHGGESLDDRVHESQHLLSEAEGAFKAGHTYRSKSNN